jgi:cyclopropane fatty-acyl-phospholipid synthase-like methyltransferase
MWDEIGALQIDFLKSQSLQPSYTLLDIGCGCLRLGVRAVEFLDTGKYWGTDLNEELLTAGYNREVIPAGLGAKLPRTNLVTDVEFTFTGAPHHVDMAIAQSVFTHLPLEQLRLCLANLANHLKGPCEFFATFFIVTDDKATASVLHEPGRITTHADKDPFHYTEKDLWRAASNLPWKVDIIGDWRHPRNQKMICFRKD